MEFYRDCIQPDCPNSSFKTNIFLDENHINFYEYGHSYVIVYRMCKVNTKNQN